MPLRSPTVLTKLNLIVTHATLLTQFPHCGTSICSAIIAPVQLCLQNMSVPRVSPFYTTYVLMSAYVVLLVCLTSYQARWAYKLIMLSGCPCFILPTSLRIYVKPDMSFMPWGLAPKPYFLISCNMTNMADIQTCEAQRTLTSLWHSLVLLFQMAAN